MFHAIAMAASSSDSKYILEPKKRPKQDRSRATFDAIVTACEELLTSQGYLALTTSQIADRAGVNIASVYEYFHTKDAIVVEVIDRVVARVIQAFSDTLADALALPFEEMLHFWVRFIYLETKREEKLGSAILLTVPFFMQVPSVLRLEARVTELVRSAYARRPNRDTTLDPESLYLMQSMTAGTVVSLVFLPNRGTDPDKVLAALARWLYRWGE